MDKSDQAHRAFVACVLEYANHQLPTSFTAPEIASAAASACHEQLATFQNDQVALYGLIHPDESPALAKSQAVAAASQLTKTADALIRQLMTERR